MTKILLIEPDINLGRIYQHFLQAVGHEVRWRTTAQAALTSVDANKPALVVLELQLAAHNGIEFLYEFRSYQDWQSIPVIIHSQVPPLLKAISPMLWDELGIAGYYYKPSTKLKDLARAVDSVLTPA
ncbi:MAG: response regulator [Candidatus Saccharimonadales bacterium]